MREARKGREEEIKLIRTRGGIEEVKSLFRLLMFSNMFVSPSFIFFLGGYITVKLEGGRGGGRDRDERGGGRNR